MDGWAPRDRTGGQSHKTVSINDSFWRERRAEADRTEILLLTQHVFYLKPRFVEICKGEMSVMQFGALMCVPVLFDTILVWTECTFDEINQFPRCCKNVVLWSTYFGYREYETSICLLSLLLLLRLSCFELFFEAVFDAVSYTHLTLPTSDGV